MSECPSSVEFLRNERRVLHLNFWLTRVPWNSNMYFELSWRNSNVPISSSWWIRRTLVSIRNSCCISKILEFLEISPSNLSLSLLWNFHPIVSCYLKMNLKYLFLVLCEEFHIILCIKIFHHLVDSNLTLQGDQNVSKIRFLAFILIIM